MSGDFDNDLIDEFDDDSYEYVPFYTMVQQAIYPKIKQYLSDYYGERMGELEAETFLELENTIKEGFIEADMIPDLLYNHRSISDEEFDAAIEAYSPSSKTFNWPRPEYWFDKDYSDDDEDTFLEDSDPIDLTEEQRLAKKAIDHINNFQEEHVAFANFVKMGFETLIQDVQQYLVKVGRFDLEILTQEGFEALQECIYYMISELLNDVYEVVETDLNNKK
jgi:hypothetical protein